MFNRISSQDPINYNKHIQTLATDPVLLQTVGEGVQQLCGVRAQGNCFEARHLLFEFRANVALNHTHCLLHLGLKNIEI